MSERERIEQAIAALEAQRPVIGDASVDAGLARLREKLSMLETDGGELSAAAVLAASIVGMCDSPTSAQESMLLPDHPLHKRLKVTLARHGGTLLPGTGGRMLAVFHAPALDDQQEDRDGIKRAARAGLELLSETRHYSTTECEGTVRLRAGIHYGFIRQLAFADTQAAVGQEEASRVAAALNDAALPGEILVSQAVAGALGRQYDVQTREPLRIAESVEMVPVYRLQGMRLQTQRLGPQGIGVQRLVGRASELSVLQANFDESLEKQALRMVTVIGEPGIGKTRLLYEFLRRLDQQGKPFVLFRARGNPSMNYQPHALLRELFAFRFKILENDPPSVARAKLIRGIEDWLGTEGLEAAHWIGQMAGFDFSDSPYLTYQSDDTRRARKMTLTALKRLLSEVAADAPLLIVVDDLQWADDGSLDGLEAIARAEAASPAMILALARPGLLDRRPKWGRSCRAHTMLNLPLLTEGETAALAGQALRSTVSDYAFGSGQAAITLPAKLIDRITEISGGNPFFIEELVQSFLEVGVLVPPTAAEDITSRTSAWRVDLERLAKLTAPRSLEEAVQLHLNGLPEVERAYIQHAAVVGQVFWDEAVRSLLASDRAVSQFDLDLVLQSLQARGLILRRDTSVFERTEEYAFRSAPLHEAAYHSISQEQRREGHNCVAGWLVEHCGPRRETYATAIAGHYDRAGQARQAAEWYARAAVQARRVSAPDAADRFYRRALEIVPPEALDLHASLYKGLWDVLWWQARYEEALATAKKYLEVAARQGDSAGQAAAWNRIAATHNRFEDHQAALRSLSNAERFARQAGATAEVVKAMFIRGMTLYRIGNEAEALEAGEQALAFNQSMLAEGAETDAVQEAAGILNLIAMIHQRAGRYVKAELNFVQVLDAARLRDDQPGIITALINLGANASLQGDYQAAASYYGEAYRLAREQAYPELEMSSLNGLAGAHVDLGDSRQAEDELRMVLRGVRDKNVPFLTDALRHLAMACLANGKAGEAEECGLKALSLAKEYSLQAQAGRAWRVLAGVAAARTGSLQVGGAIYDAHACFAASLQIFVEQGMPAEQARTIRAWATYELASGDRREGLRLWKESRDVFRRLDMQVEVEQMDRQLARSGGYPAGL